jgi:hypothetical protein
MRLLNRRVADIALLGVFLAAFAGPASAQTLYQNGQINGQLSGWTLNFGSAVADSFILAGSSTLDEVEFGAWNYSGDSTTFIDWAIVTGTPFSAETVVAFRTGVPVSDSFLYSNGSAYDVSLDSFSLPSVPLGAGTYYLELQNAVTSGSNYAYWDINNGPSIAYENTLGNVNGYLFLGSNSDAFLISGPSGASTLLTPEPGTLALLVTGLLFLAGLRRRLSFS